MLFKFLSPLRLSLYKRCLLISWAVAGLLCSSLFGFSEPAIAGAIDAYVSRYLDVAQPVVLPMDDRGTTADFSAEDLSQGKRLFEESCINCHVGGATLPDPTIPLSLAALQGATPPRDNVTSIVEFLRMPMTYDGSEETFWCRQVSERWMSDTAVENLAAFVLRAAQKAPGWGKSDF